MGIPLLVSLSFEVDTPEQTTKVLDAIDPPNLPYFTGKARVSVAGDALDAVKFLDTNTIAPLTDGKTLDGALCDVYLLGICSGVTSILVRVGHDPGESLTYAQTEIRKMLDDPAILGTALPAMRRAWLDRNAAETLMTTRHMGTIAVHRPDGD